MFRPAVMATCVGFAVSLATGCVSRLSRRRAVSAILAQTAPADLQLTCATAAATSFGVDSSGILPVSSSQLDAQKYQVDLDVQGSRATCVVDTAGNVLSVQKV